MRCRFIGVLLVLPACGGPADGTGPVQVYVAASAGDAVTSALAGCADPHAQDAVVVTASSATLARQIEHGAPADLFVSASPEWVDHLQDRTLIVPSSRTVLLGNALVVVASADEPSLLASLSGEALTARLGGGRLAVGDPDHVPAGRYAQEAFESLGVWDDIQPQLAPAADVRAALMLVERGEAPLGVVYTTDARASERVAVVAAVPPDTHSPVRYPLATVAGRSTRPGVQQTTDCLLGETARQVFADRGFRLP